MHSPALLVRKQEIKVFLVNNNNCSLPSAVSSDVTNPAYDMAFNSLSYSKGSCIVKMVEGFLTAEVFNKGINLYLQENQ